MISRRSAVAIFVLAACGYLKPDQAQADDDQDEKGMVDPNPAWIVNGPTMRNSKRVSYRELSGTIGTVADAAKIAKKLSQKVGFGVPVKACLSLVRHSASIIEKGLKRADQNAGIQVNFLKTDRYVQNPATGHKSYYDTQYGFQSVALYG